MMNVEIEISEENVRKENGKIVVEIEDCDEFIDDLKEEIRTAMLRDVREAVKIARALIKISEEETAKKVFVESFRREYYENIQDDASIGEFIKAWKMRDELVKLFGKRLGKLLQKIRKIVITSYEVTRRIYSIENIIEGLDLNENEEKEFVKVWVKAHNIRENFLYNREILMKHKDVVRGKITKIGYSSAEEIKLLWVDYYYTPIGRNKEEFEECVSFLDTFWNELSEEVKRNIREFLKAKREDLIKMIKRRIKKSHFKETMTALAKMSGDKEVIKLLMLEEL